ncbi:hypothetical protein [Streptomyces sp. NPDC005784]|uniref:hypothetical protein n=1 Tax=Streptomyces sp. NPDC005784 TaxID=3364731 RepID=UPI003675728C
MVELKEFLTGRCDEQFAEFGTRFPASLGVTAGCPTTTRATSVATRRQATGTTQRQRKDRRPWTGFCAAQYAVSEVADWIVGLRLLDRRRTPWRMDMADLAYGPSLRPNPFVERLAHRGLIALGGWL